MRQRNADVEFVRCPLSVVEGKAPALVMHRRCADGARASQAAGHNTRENGGKKGRAAAQSLELPWNAEVTDGLAASVCGGARC
jgi:hypothetical protein